MRIFKLVLVLFVIVAVSGAGHAGEGGGGEGGYGGGSSYRSGGKALSAATTNRVVRLLTRGGERCRKLDKVYRYDCYRVAYKAAADEIARKPAYAEAAAALREVEAVISRTVNANLDKTAPQKRRGGQRFRAIRPEALPKAKRDLTQALDRAETKLLRSADRTNTHFVRIAQAVNSNKVLIRSARAWLIQMARAGGLRFAG